MSSTNRTMCFGVKGTFCLVTAISVVLLLLFTGVDLAAESNSVQHYKMISTVEYAGKGQFRNQVEELFTVKEKPLSNDKVQYFISAEDLFNELSFVVDRGTSNCHKSVKA